MAFDTICKKKDNDFHSENRDIPQRFQIDHQNTLGGKSPFSQFVSHIVLWKQWQLFDLESQEIIRKLLEVAISYLTSPDSGWAFGKP